MLPKKNPSLTYKKTVVYTLLLDLLLCYLFHGRQLNGKRTTKMIMDTKR